MLIIIHSSNGSICVCKKIFKQDKPGPMAWACGCFLFCNTKTTALLEVCSGKRLLLSLYVMVIKTQLIVRQHYVCGLCFRSLFPPDFLLYFSKVEIRLWIHL